MGDKRLGYKQRAVLFRKLSDSNERIDCFKRQGLIVEGELGVNEEKMRGYIQRNDENVVESLDMLERNQINRERKVVTPNGKF